MERLLDRKNILRHAEIEQRIAGYLDDACGRTPPDPHGRDWPLPDARKIRWGAWRKEVAVTPRYQLGARVRVRNIHPEGHTRVTAYTRGKTGTISIVNAQAWVFPDTRAHHRGENLQPVYNVRFDARGLWGPQAEPNVFTHIDLSEDHLEPFDGDKT